MDVGATRRVAPTRNAPTGEAATSRRRITVKHQTIRKQIGHGQYEPLPQYGWRCGFYSLTPELERHAKNPEFLTGLRRGRQQRCAISPVYAQALGLILCRRELRELRANIQSVYGEAMEADRRSACFARAAVYAGGAVSCIGNSIGASRMTESDRIGDEAEQLWAEYGRLNQVYEQRVKGLCAVRRIPPH
jgi:hypothetical protein